MRGNKTLYNSYIKCASWGEEKEKKRKTGKFVYTFTSSQYCTTTKNYSNNMVVKRKNYTKQNKKQKPFWNKKSPNLKTFNEK